MGTEAVPYRRGRTSACYYIHEVQRETSGDFGYWRTSRHVATFVASDARGGDLGRLRGLETVVLCEGRPVLCGIPALGWLNAFFLYVHSVCWYMNADGVRHQSDRAENSQVTQKFTVCPQKYDLDQVKATTVAWDSLRVGDMVLCMNREAFPADMLLLASSRADGRAMVETTSLDGETNLKFRFVPRPMHDNGFSTYENSQRLSGAVTYDMPSPSLDSFHGRCQLSLLEGFPSRSLTMVCGDEQREQQQQQVGGAVSGLEFPIGLDNIVLRGCKLRNTEWIIGLILYAGHDTKIYQNMRTPPRKVSRTEQETNLLLLISFTILFAICMAYSLGSVLLQVSGRAPTVPFLLPTFILKRALTRFVSWNLLVVNLIPISLFFFLNISRVLQAQAMQNDRSMEHPETMERLKVRNDKLNSDLGQVQYIFTDKTGTLTRNYMELRRLCVGGVSYGELFQGIVETPHVTIDDVGLRQRIVKRDKEVWDFFLHLAINHSVFLEDGNTGSDNTEVVTRTCPVYSASSADEGVLVYCAAHFGFVLRAQMGSVVEVEVPDGERVRVEVLTRFNFTSERKRSSVLVRWKDAPDASKSRIALFLKGADSVVRPRLNPTELTSGSVCRTFANVHSYAKLGLRVLCIAFREVSPEELKRWLPRYQAATAALDFVEEEKLVNEMENGLQLCGCVGVEDKLADDVTKAIRLLKAANIQLVMATGDKLETAVNIGIQSGLFPPNANVIRVDIADCACDIVSDALRTAMNHPLLPDLNKDKKSFSEAIKKWGSNSPASLIPGRRPSFVVDSVALTELLEKAPDLVVSIVTIGDGVIMCRTTPQQKADVVYTVRKYFNNSVVTLAIGDGGNDCTMLQTANIGVGIRGTEGLQAVNVSDYGVSRFRDLVPLLLVHGRWNHRRLGKLVIYTLCKVVVINIPQILAGTLSLLTPQRIFAESINQCVNPVFSSVAPIVFAVLDYDIPGDTAIRFPSSYILGMSRAVFRPRVYFQALASAIAHGTIAFVVTYALMGVGYVTQNGTPVDLWTTGTTAFYCALFLMTQKLNFECLSSFPLVVLVNLARWVSMSFFYYSDFNTGQSAALRVCSVSMFFVAMMSIRSLSETGHQLIACPLFYISWILTFALGIFHTYFWKVYKRCRYPTASHQIQKCILHEKDDSIPVSFPTLKSENCWRDFCFFDEPDQRVVVFLGPVCTVLLRRSGMNVLENEESSLVASVFVVFSVTAVLGSVYQRKSS